MNSLDKQVVLITGASRGVGAACAVACARQGAKVALAGKSVATHPTLPGTLGEVASEIVAAGGQALALPTDVRCEDQVEAMLAQTVEHFGRLDALINNAGAIFLAPLAEWPTKRFDLVFDVNVRAAFLTCRAAIPHLRERGGHIIMMSPPVCTQGAAGKGPYVVSKFGMTLLAAAIDGEEPNIATHALWPVTALKTAATIHFGLGTERDWRTPDILADATLALLRRHPKDCTFRAWLDEEILAEEGVTDFSQYRCNPDHEPAPMSITMINPDWSRSAGRGGGSGAGGD